RDLHKCQQSPDSIRTPLRVLKEVPIVNRRTFLNSCCASWLTIAAPGMAWQRADSGRRIRIWDDHCHLGSVPGDTPEERIAVLVQCADRLGIERLLVSQGFSANLHPTADQLREENDRVLRAVRRFPDRSYGSVYLSPAFPELSIEEFNRCVRDGP